MGQTGQFRPLLSPIPPRVDGVGYKAGKSDTPLGRGCPLAQRISLFRSAKECLPPLPSTSNDDNQYLGKTEFKSLAPDGKACQPETEGLLGRARIVARSLIPVGKETDRHWEQGEDPSMLDPKTQIYGPSGKLVVADNSERKEWAKIGVRRLMRASRLTQRTVYSILSGKGVRLQTIAIFRIGIDSLRA
jgi:hypothetical protein